MLNLALRTLRARRVSFAGSFLALALGVALLCVTGLALASSLDAPPRGPERFAAAPVLVRGPDTLRVRTPIGDREQRLAHPRPVPAAALAKLRALGTVTEDRAFPVRADGGPGGLLGHPWSTAAFAPYTLRTGRAPVSADEVVVSGDWAPAGTRLRTGHGTVRVVGTVAARPFERAVFFTDRRAAVLAPASTQLVVDAAPSAVRAAVRSTPGTAGVHVLTGDARRLADADPDRDAEALTVLGALFGTASGVTAFVSVFVVASTFAFTVAQRRREFGLLRTAGATPGQVRRLVLTEAALVGVLASAAGCVLGAYGAAPLTARVVGLGLAPRWFTLHPHAWPFHLAFWTGLLVALCGALAASWSAGRTGPVQVLREASADRGGALTRGRLLCGAALLLTTGALLALALVDDPGGLLHRKSYVTRPMPLICAAALLAPALVRPATRLLTWLPAQLPGATGLLVRENAAGAVRRTAATAAPVLITVALAGSLLGATATLGSARTEEIRTRTGAHLVVVPAAPDAALDADAARTLRAVPGVARVSASASTAVYALEDGVALVRSGARAAAPGPLAATARLPLAAGRAEDLDDDSIIVNEEWRRHTVGQRVRVWLGDGTRRTLRVAAVMTTGTGDNGAYVTPRNAPGAHVDRAEVTLTQGTDPATVTAGLARAARAAGGQVLTKEQWVRASSPDSKRTTRIGLYLVLGIALLYTGIALVATTVMATTDRLRELAVLRLSGATPGQILRIVAAEALAVVAVGTALGALTAVLGLAGLWGAMTLQSAPGTLTLPWAALATTAGACAVLAVTASVLPAAFALRGMRAGGGAAAGPRV